MLTYFGVFTPLNVGRSIAMDVLRSQEVLSDSEPTDHSPSGLANQSVGQEWVASARKRRHRGHECKSDINESNHQPEKRSDIDNPKINSRS